jgi:DNA-binding CsgD family transcriptional regulator
VATQTDATLLERDRELQALMRLLREAQQERGQLALIDGPAGLGKTTLLKAAATAAADLGFTCLRARASELERDFSYGCVRQLLEPVVARATGIARERLFEGAAALAMPLFERNAIPAVAATDNTFSVLHGLYWLVNNLTREGPVLFCLDDLQWADVESLRFLGHLAPRLDGLALAAVASVRSPENATPDLARLFTSPEATIVRPEPLSVEAVATLCERRLGAIPAPDFASACHAATGGNPLFLEMLLREAKELRFLTDAAEAARVRRFGPGAVARAVLLRLAGAPAAATDLVRAVAVLGDASVVEASRLAGLAEDDAARAADLLVDLAILKQGERLEFAHPIVSQAIYEDIGLHERARAHAHAARVLSEGGAAEERIATQIAAAEPAGDPARVGVLRRVASGALAKGAPAAAVTWLRRALAEPPPIDTRAEVLLELGCAELRLAMPESTEHLSAAVTEIRNPALLAAAVRQLANAFSFSGHAERAIEAIEANIERVHALNAELALVLEAEFAAKALQASREARARAAERLAQHRELKGITPGERLVLACQAFEQARASENAGDAVRFIERGLAVGGLIGEQQPDVVGPFYALTIGLLGTDALDLAGRQIDLALADARARGSIPATAFLIVHRGWFSLRGGSVAGAEADARTALDLMNTHDIRQGRRFAMALLIEALLENGDIEGASRELRESGLDAQIPPGLAHNNLLEARGVLRLARNDAGGALEDFVEFGRRDELWSAANPLASRWRCRACHALVVLGKTEQARDMAAEELTRAKRWGAASGIGMALRAAALVETGPAAIDLLRESAQTLARSPAKLEHARSLADLGAALRRANRRADARDDLRDALAIARACGGGALAAHVETELRAAGGRSSDLEGNGLERLTVSERRVAELAARGYSNPRIAQELFVTRKTVETHLGHIYDKLDIAGRAELGHVLGHLQQGTQRISAQRSGSSPTRSG